MRETKAVLDPKTDRTGTVLGTEDMAVTTEARILVLALQDTVKPHVVKGFVPSHYYSVCGRYMPYGGASLPFSVSNDQATITLPSGKNITLSGEDISHKEERSLESVGRIKKDPTGKVLEFQGRDGQNSPFSVSVYADGHCIAKGMVLTMANGQYRSSLMETK